MRRAAAVLAGFLAAQSATLTAVRIAALIVVPSVVSITAEGTALGKSRRRKSSKKKPKLAPASSSRADGRDHLKKANGFAAKGHCELAIEEYTLAFDRLNDPEILLARGECRRKIGQDADAIADFKAYLEVTPDVPNKKEIDAKIAALEGGGATGPAVETAPPPPKKPPPPPPPPPPFARTPPPPVTPPPPATPPPVTPPPPPVTTIEPPAAPIEEAPRPPPATSAPALATAPEAGKLPGTDVEARPAESRGRLWLWTIVAVVVAGGAAAAGYYYLRPVDVPPPETALGNYKF